MTNVTRILLEEHQNMLKVIDVILSECDKIETGL